MWANICKDHMLLVKGLPPWWHGVKQKVVLRKECWTEHVVVVVWPTFIHMHVSLWWPELTHVHSTHAACGSLFIRLNCVKSEHFLSFTLLVFSPLTWALTCLAVKRCDVPWWESTFIFMHVWWYVPNCMGAQIVGARSLSQLNFLWWFLTFVSSECGTCLILAFWHIEFLRWLLGFEKFVQPCLTESIFSHRNLGWMLLITY
jgi:hypothetical protein